MKTKTKSGAFSRTARGRSENRQREKSNDSSNLTKSPVSGEVANLFLRRKSTDLFKPRSESFNQPRKLNQDLSEDHFSDIDTSFEEVEYR